MSFKENVVLLGTRKGLFTLKVGSQGWEIAQQKFAGQPVAYATGDPRNGTLWACLDHGHWGQKLHRSTDGGESWTEVEAPKYPEGSEIREGVPATVRYLWYVAPGGSDQPNRIYVGTEPGGLFKSDDGGDSFTLVDSLWNHPSRPARWFGGGRDEAGIHSIFVDPRDSNRVLIGVSCAGVFETTDDGTNWTPRNRGLSATFLPDPNTDVGHDPHYVAFCPTNPDVMWQQNHCGIFRSTDGGGNWEDISEKEGPANFGFAIAAHDDPETAWVVPADSDERRIAVNGGVMVCRTENGGKSWKSLTNGLPQHNSYDITFRHALDNNGDRLIFGTTTGNVYASEDGGDQWYCVGNNFPPVYSARFAEIA